MLPLPSSSKLYTMAQDYNWGDTSMGESQWIANMKVSYGNGWRRTVHNTLLNNSNLNAEAPPVKTQVNANKPQVNPNFGMFEFPFDRPVDHPVSWKPKNLIKNMTQCMNQLDMTACSPENRFIHVDKSAYHYYGFAQDGSDHKKVPLFQFKRLGGIGTSGIGTNYVERSASEQMVLNKKMDDWCTGIVNSCNTRFPETGGGNTGGEVIGCMQSAATNFDSYATEDDGSCIFPSGPSSQPLPVDIPGGKKDEGTEDFIKKYKYPLIAAGVIIIGFMLMKKTAQPTVIVTK